MEMLLKSLDTDILRPVVFPKQAAEIDKYMIEFLEIPGIVLMEQAATALARTIMERFPEPCTVLCVCGSGNNGGDAWAVGRILLSFGYNVRCGATTLNLPHDAHSNMRLFTHTSRITILDNSSLDDFFSIPAKVIVDGLFGTGISRSPVGIYERIINKINQHSATVVSVDIPSGVYERGGYECAVKADITVTFQYPKIAHFMFPARKLIGELKIARIGVDEGFPPFDIFHAEYIAPLSRDPQSNKGTYGRLAVIAGCKGMTGAATLAVRAAVAAGAGITKFIGCEYSANVMQHTVPEAMAQAVPGDDYIIPSEALLEACEFGTALAIGCGMGVHEELYDPLVQILKLPVPKVVDADALNIIAKNPECLIYAQNTLITPHPREFSRLSGLSIEEVLGNPIVSARNFAKKYRITVLLKGPTTVVTDGKTTILVTAGHPCMAKGGSGDVLTGVAGALLAQGKSEFSAGYIAAYMCGKAGERAALKKNQYSPCARDTIENL